MATYTDIDSASLERFLYMFELGELASFSAISAGIENSNYFVTLDSGAEFVLTIAEDISLDQVSFFSDLLHQMIRAGIAAPEPQRTLDGMSSTLFKGKPTWLFSRLPGSHVIEPSVEQCRNIGSVLASIHAAAKKCSYQRANVYHSDWAKGAIHANKDKLSDNHRHNLETLARDYSAIETSPFDLPRGIIHGDLFRDNALFLGPDLTGVIDFYHACEDYLVQDLAIAINDWCLDASQVDPTKQTALIEGYEEVRALLPEERQRLPLFCQFAAMRFALTRLLANQTDNPDRQPESMLALLG